MSAVAKKGAAPASVPARQVVVAARTVDPGHPLTAEDLLVAELAETPGSPPATSTFDRAEDVVGRVSFERILVHEVIRAERLADPLQGQGLGALVPRGMKAVTLTFRGAHRVEGISPGFYVDVLGLLPDAAGRPEVQTIWQAVFVMAVDEVTTPTESLRADRSFAVTVLLTQRQTEDVLWVEETGRLRLVVRSLGDVEYHPEYADHPPGDLTPSTF